MPTDMMLNIAAENLETQTNLAVGEQRRAGLIKPHHIWISRWVGKKNSKTKPKEELVDMLSVPADSFGVHSSATFQCSQSSLQLPDPQSALCGGVPERFCNQPPPVGPGRE